MGCPSESETSPPVVPLVAGQEGAALFVWGTWALLLVGVLTFLRLYGTNIPYYDEYCAVEMLTGDQPLTLKYLWSQHNEHRIPLPRLIYLGLARLTHDDFRAGTYFNGLALGVLAAGMILAARRLRGGTTYADAFFPLALLHVGHVENLVWSFQVQFISSTLLVGCLLWLILRSRQPLTTRTGLAGGVSLLLLPLCGANGLPFVLPLAGWLIAWAWRDRRTPGGVRHLLLVLMLTAAALSLVVFYFHGLTKVTAHPASLSWRNTFQVALEFFTMGAGAGVIPLWPYAGYILGALLVFSLAILAGQCWRQPRERVRCLGLLLFLVGMIGLAGGIGYGRAGMGLVMGFSLRYTTLAVPALCGVYFIGDIAGTARVARFLQMGLFTCLGVLLIPNIQAGVAFGKARHASLMAVAKDLQSGFTAGQVGQKHFFLYPARDYLIARLEMLRRAGIGKFKRLSAPPPALREIPVPVTPALATQITWKGGSGQITGTNACLGFVLPQPRRVYGIRLTYAFADKPEPTANFVMYWKQSARNDYSEAVRNARFPLEASPGPRQVVIYVNDTVDQFIIRPDVRPCTFTLSGIQLLVPKEDKKSTDHTDHTEIRN